MSTGSVRDRLPMTDKPKLTICVPSRNRQDTFRQTIRDLLGNPRRDVEFVFADNSDDPAIMNGFMAAIADPRVRYLPSPADCLPMLDNWERAMRAASGDWVTFIGDDDYADPDIAGVIAQIEGARPDVEAIEWSRLFYTWADDDQPPSGQFVVLDDKIRDVPRQALTERAFGWRNAKTTIDCGFSIYHGAVSRPLIERITARYGGRFFEFPVVDYESIFKIVMNGRGFVKCSRPLSVLGASPLSNSAALKDLKEQERKQDLFDRELDQPLDQMACFADYPFKSRFGIAACAGMVHHWFADRHGTQFSGFEENFTRACEAQCNGIGNREDFDLVVARYRSAFGSWRGGRYLKFFRPTFTEPAPSIPFAGVANGQLHVTADAEFSPTCAAYYHLVSAALTPAADLKVEIELDEAADTRERKRA